MVAISSAAAVLVASLIQGPPDRLPAIALGWPVLLYFERVAVIALVIVGIGGVLYRLMVGGQVAGAGGLPPNVAIEDATKPTEALKEGVDKDVKDLNERLTAVEKKLEGE